MLINLPEVTQPVRRGSGLGSKIYVRNHHRSAHLNFSWVPLNYIASTEHHELKNQKQQVLAKEKAFLVFKLHCYRSPGGLKVKVAQSCPTFWDPMDYTVHGILPARILEWVAVPFSRGSSQPRDRTQVSPIAGGFFTSWATRETQEHWSG